MNSPKKKSGSVSSWITGGGQSANIIFSTDLSAHKIIMEEKEGNEEKVCSNRLGKIRL